MIVSVNKYPLGNSMFHPETAKHNGILKNTIRGE